MIRFDVEFAPLNVQRMGDAATRTEKILAAQVLKDTNPYVPALTTKFASLARVEGNEIIYVGKQARYLWNGKKMVDAETGKGPAYIPDVGYRFRKFSHLTPTAQDLVFNKSVHPKAQAKWFLASKKANLQKWLRVAEKAVIDEYGK